MCYSAQIVEDYRQYVRMFGADMSIGDFAQLYWERVEGSGAKIPKGVMQPLPTWKPRLNAG
jgi:hypothetical protein